MNVFIEKTQEDKTLLFSGPAQALLDLLNINAEEVLVVRNGELITEDCLLTNDDVVRLLSVVSGG